MNEEKVENKKKEAKKNKREIYNKMMKMAQ